MGRNRIAISKERENDDRMMKGMTHKKGENDYRVPLTTPRMTPHEGFFLKGFLQHI
jgi:hypothetical protein